MEDRNIRISGETHSLLTKLVQSRGLLLGKYADLVIREKLQKEIDREEKKSSKKEHG